jgi:hypothetical protein
LDRQGGEQCALNVVFLRHRGAKQRHEPVAGELRDRAAVAIHFGEAGGHKRGDEVAHSLGSEPFGQRRRADNVAKQDRDLFHLARKRIPGIG